MTGTLWCLVMADGGEVAELGHFGSLSDKRAQAGPPTSQRGHSHIGGITLRKRLKTTVPGILLDFQGIRIGIY